MDNVQQAGDLLHLIADDPWRRRQGTQLLGQSQPELAVPAAGRLQRGRWPAGVWPRYLTTAAVRLWTWSFS